MPHSINIDDRELEEQLLADEEENRRRRAQRYIEAKRERKVHLRCLDIAGLYRGC